MTDAALALVPHYGGWLLVLVTFLSCLAVPMPASLMMLAGGAFVASGDLGLGAALSAAWGGAVAGDQTGYLIGRKGGAPLIDRLRARRKAREALGRAGDLTARHGGLAVFLTRWLFSPLGPYVNLIGGAMGLGWRRFTLGSLGGEAVWVALYTALGFVFADRIAQVADIASNVAGFLAAALVAALLGWILFRRRGNPGARPRPEPRTG